MGRLIYSMTVSLDGYTADPNGEIDWSAPTPELHQFHNDRTRELGAHVCGRRLYETMRYWDTAHEDPAAGPIEREFAAIWQALPQLVFSTTLTKVEGNARLAAGSVAEEIAALKEQTEKDIGVGGAGLAAECLRLGLIDEIQAFVSPVVLGGGTPFLPPLDRRVRLELLETRTFAERVVLLRHRVAA